jgi:hypothetical protein
VKVGARRPAPRRRVGRAPRPCAGRPRRPCRNPPQAARRPRCSFPTRSRLEAPRSPPSRAPPRPRLTGRVCATDRRSDGRAPAVRAPAEGQYHGEHLAPSPLRHRSERAYKNRPILLPRAPPPSSIPPLPPPPEHPLLRPSPFQPEPPSTFPR